MRDPAGQVRRHQADRLLLWRGVLDPRVPGQLRSETGKTARAVTQVTALVRYGFGGRGELKRFPDFAALI